jgi:hypothetical protein
MDVPSRSFNDFFMHDIEGELAKERESTLIKRAVEAKLSAPLGRGAECYDSNH